MIANCGAPDCFWGLAFQAAVYLLNRRPQKYSNMTPYERYESKKPTVEHLRTFGCLAYMHVDQELRSKLQYRAIGCVFLGYSTDHAAYVVLEISTNKLVVSRDLVFDESIYPFREVETEIGSKLRINSLMKYFVTPPILNQQQSSQMICMTKQLDRNDELDPQTIEEALSSINKIEWEEAIKSEIQNFD